mgnify:CR=1 FL=1
MGIADGLCPKSQPEYCLFVFNNGLRRSQARNGYAERRAGYIVEAGSVAEFYRGGIAAVLAANTELNVGLGLAAQLDCHLDQLAKIFFA